MAATVFIVDDDPAIRDALSLLIDLEGMAVRVFENAEAFLAACQPEWRGCLVTDVRMPGMSGVELQAELTRRNVNLPLIFLTGYGDIPMSVKAIKAGAVDFLTKPVSATALLESLQTALNEDEKRQMEAAASQAATERLASLTERERLVMEQAIAGLSNKEIARQLDISHRTVEIHKSRVMHKTGAISIIELARIAKAGGWQA